MDNNYTKNKSAYYLTTTLVVMCFLIAGIGILKDTYFAKEELVATVDEVPLLHYVNPFDSVSITAQAAYVADLNTGKVLYQKNATDTLPLASLTKLMTALTATELVSKQKIVTLQSASLNTEGEYGLKVGERWKLQDLIDFALVKSSNDAAAAVAEGVETLDGGGETFVTRMNQLAKQIGLTHTEFFNETGLDISSSQSGANGSAEDMGKLMAYILTHQPELLEATRYADVNLYSVEGVKHSAENTNTSTGIIPNLLASKTGYTDLAGGNLVIAYDAGLNRPIIIAVLGSTQEGRFEDVIKLAETTLNYISQSER